MKLDDLLNNAVGMATLQLPEWRAKLLQFAMHSSKDDLAILASILNEYNSSREKEIRKIRENWETGKGYSDLISRIYAK